MDHPSGWSIALSLNASLLAVAYWARAIAKVIIAAAADKFKLSA